MCNVASNPFYDADALTQQIIALERISSRYRELYRSVKDAIEGCMVDRGDEVTAIYLANKQWDDLVKIIGAQ